MQDGNQKRSQPYYAHSDYCARRYPVDLLLVRTWSALWLIPTNPRSWRPELFDPATSFNVIQYIFNPVYYLVKNITVVMYVASFVTFVVLAAVMGYCTSGLVKG
jgi:hypothetical protein